MRNRIIKMLILALLTFGAAGPSIAKEKFKVAWSIYVGWMPWNYAEETGVLDKWADKYGIEIELIRMDYIASIEAYVAGQVDACTMTNMECLDMPAASGIDSTALIIGDYSNGNDALLVRGGLSMAGLEGKDVSLVELSVSHYLLARALEKNGMEESQVRVVNTSDADIGPVFLSNTSQQAVVTWNPIVMQIAQAPGVSKIFTSADIPGEIIDLMVVNTKTLNQNPALGKALVGAWYEVMAIMSRRGPVANAAIQAMAEASECTPDEFGAQLKITAMFYQPSAAIDYGRSEEIKTKMNFVRRFCFNQGLLGHNAPNADVVGIQYPDGSVQGDRDRVFFRWNVDYMQMAADGKL